jgi:L-fucose mutarotase/ribose pyranase (RbsD/FucU family)
MVKLYTNENFPLPVVESLRELGHDVLTSLEAGNANRSVPDEAVLAVAVAEDRVIGTINRKHFLRLHSRNPHHPGMVICTYGPDFYRQAQRIHQALRSSESLAGMLVRVNRPAS